MCYHTLFQVYTHKLGAIFTILPRKLPPHFCSQGCSGSQIPRFLGRRSNPNEWELECHTGCWTAFNGPAAQDIAPRLISTPTHPPSRVGRGNREIISSGGIVQTQEEESGQRHQLETQTRAARNLIFADNHYPRTPCNAQFSFNMYVSCWYL